MLLDQVGDPALKTDQGQTSQLVRIWRECDAGETERLRRKTTGTRPDDLEDPLQEGTHSTAIERFETHGIHWKPALTEALCEPLYGRLWRESTHTSPCTVIPLDRIRTIAEVPRTSVGRTLGVAPRGGPSASWQRWGGWTQAGRT